MYDKERLEGIVPIMQYYYDKGMHLQVNMYYHYYEKFKIVNPNLKLFYKKHICKNFYYLNSISASYIDNKEYKVFMTYCKPTDKKEDKK